MLSQKKRKILTRIMAGIALGASLFGIASSAGAKIVLPKKTQFNFKKRQDIKNKKDLKSRIDSLAVKEAEQVLTQQQLSEETSKKRKKQPKKVLHPLKYLGLAVWGGSLLLFASCLLANEPFPLGNFVLMAMPGEKHNAVLFLEPAEAAYQVGNEFDLDLTVETGGREVSLVSAGLEFDPKKLQVQQINILQSGFRETIENFFDNNSGRIKIARTFPKEAIRGSSKILIASVKFKILPFIGAAKINFAQNEEWTVNGVFLSGGSEANILKETKGGSYRINPKILPAKKIKAKKITEAVKIDGCLDDWQDIIGGDLFSETKPQNKIEQENIFEGGIRCPAPMEGVRRLSDRLQDIAVFDLAWDEKNIYFAAVVIDNQTADKDSLEISLENEKFTISEKESAGDQLLQLQELVSCKEIEGAYIVEAAFPRENKLGDEFNFNIIANDYGENKEAPNRFRWSEEGIVELE
jgi:hypothetical protein